MNRIWFMGAASGTSATATVGWLFECSTAAGFVTAALFFLVAVTAPRS